MKYKFFCALLSSLVLTGCSQIHYTKRIPASVKDVGVIGPNGEVILYYKEGDYIIVKACDPNTILGTTPEEARINCQGKSNRVPLKSFKESIRNHVSTEWLNVLKPLTPEEVDAYIKGGPSIDQIEAMDIELKKIYNFIANYGAENANLIRKEELVKALRSQETRMSAIKKINDEIGKAVDLIADQFKLTLKKFNPDKDQFLYTVLKQFNPNQKFPCGLKGSVDERIKDCSYQLTSSTEGFVLVTRSEEFKEVHKEIATGLLWSDRLPNKMTHYNAGNACNSSLKEVAGISSLTWRLPSQGEYLQAEKNGIKKALPNMNHWFWTSLVYGGNSSNVTWLFCGVQHNTNFDTYRDDYESVRCVAR